MLTLIVTRRRRSCTRRDHEFYWDAEREALAALIESGVLRGVLFRRDSRGVVMLMHAANEKSAGALAEQLPSVAMGTAAYQALGVRTALIPLSP